MSSLWGWTGRPRPMLEVRWEGYKNNYLQNPSISLFLVCAVMSMKWFFGGGNEEEVEKEDDFLNRIFGDMKTYMEKIDGFEHLEKVSNLISMFQNLSRMSDDIDKRFPEDKGKEVDIDFEIIPVILEEVDQRQIGLKMWIKHNIERATLKIHEIIQSENDMLDDLERQGSESENFFFLWTIRAKDIKDTILWIIGEHSLNRYQYGPLSGIRESLEELLAKYDEIRKNVLLDDNLLGSELEGFLKDLNRERGGQTIILDNVIGIKSVPELNDVCTKKSTVLQIGEVCRFFTFEFHIVVTTTTGIILVFRNAEDRSLEHVLNIHERKGLEKVRVIRNVDVCENHLLVCYQKPYDDENDDFFKEQRGTDDVSSATKEEEEEGESSDDDSLEGEDIIVVWNLDSGVIDYENLSVLCKFCFFFNDKYSIVVFHNKMRASYYYLSERMLTEKSISKWNEITMDSELKHFQEFIRVDKIDFNNQYPHRQFDEEEEEESEEEGEENKDLTRLLDEVKTSQHRQHVLFVVRTRKEFGILDFGFYNYKGWRTYFVSKNTNLRMNLVSFVQDDIRDYVRIERPLGCSKFLCFFDVINVTSYLEPDDIGKISENSEGKEIDPHSNSDNESEATKRKTLQRPRDQVLRFIVGWGSNVQYMTLCWKSKLETVPSVYHPDLAIFSDDADQAEESEVVVKKKKMKDREKKKYIPPEFTRTSHYQVFVENQFHMKGECICGMYFFGPKHVVVWEKADNELRAGLYEYGKSFESECREFMKLPEKYKSTGEDDDTDDSDDSDEESDETDEDSAAKKLVEEAKKKLKKMELDHCYEYFELPSNIPPLYIRKQKSMFFQRFSSSSAKKKEGAVKQQGRSVGLDQLMMEGPSIFRQLFLLAWEERMENLRRGVAAPGPGVFIQQSEAEGKKEKSNFANPKEKQRSIFECYKLGERILTGAEQVMVGEDDLDMYNSGVQGNNEGEDQGGYIRQRVHPKIREDVTNYICQLREKEFGKFGEGDELMKELHDSFRFCVAYDRVDFFFRKLFNLCIDACQPDRKQEYFDEVLLLIKRNHQIKRLPHEFIRRYYPDDYIGENEGKRKRGGQGGTSGGLIEDNDEGESEDEDDIVENEERALDAQFAHKNPEEAEEKPRSSTLIEILIMKREQFTDLDIRTIRRIVRLSEKIDMFEMQMKYQVELYENRDKTSTEVDMVEFIYFYLQKVDRKRKQIEVYLEAENRVLKERKKREEDGISSSEEESSDSDAESDGDEDDEDENLTEEERTLKKIREKKDWLYSGSEKYYEEVMSLQQARKMFVWFLKVRKRAVCTSRDVFNYLVNNVYTIAKKLGFDQFIEARGYEIQQQLDGEGGEENVVEESVAEKKLYSEEKEFHVSHIFNWIQNYMVEDSFNKKQVEDVIDRLRNVLKTELSNYTPEEQMKMIAREEDRRKIAREKELQRRNADGEGGEEDSERALRIARAMEFEDDEVEPDGLLFLATAASDPKERKLKQLSMIENENVVKDNVFRICAYEYYKFVIKIYTESLPNFGIKRFMDQIDDFPAPEGVENGDDGKGGKKEIADEGEGGSSDVDDEEKEKFLQYQREMLLNRRSNVHKRVPKLSEKFQDTILGGVFNEKKKKYHNLAYMCIHCIIHLSEVNGVDEASFIKQFDLDDDDEEEEDEGEEDEGEEDDETTDESSDEEDEDERRRKERKKKKKKKRGQPDIRVRLENTLELIDQFLQFLTEKDPTALPQEALAVLTNEAEGRRLSGLKRIIALRLKDQVRSQRLKHMIRRFGAQPNKTNLVEMKELLKTFWEEKDLRIFYDELFEMFEEAASDSHRWYIGEFINEFLSHILKKCREDILTKKGGRIEDKMMEKRLVMNEKFHENFVKVLVEHWVQIQKRFDDEDPPEKTKGVNEIWNRHWKSTDDYYNEIEKKMDTRQKDRAMEELDAKRRLNQLGRPGYPSKGGGEAKKDEKKFGSLDGKYYKRIQKETWLYIRYLREKAGPLNLDKMKEDTLISIIKNLRFCMIRYDQREIEEKIIQYFCEIGFEFKLERMLRVCGMVPRIRMLLFSRFLEYESTADEITRYLDTLLGVLLRELNDIHPPRPQVNKEWKEAHHRAMSILYRNLVRKRVNEILGRRSKESSSSGYQAEEEDEDDGGATVVTGLSGEEIGVLVTTVRTDIRELNKSLEQAIYRDNKFYDVEDDESVFPKLRMEKYTNLRQFMEEIPVKDYMNQPQKDFDPFLNKRMFLSDQGYPRNDLVTYFKCIDYEWRKEIVKYILSMRLKPQEDQIDVERQKAMWEDTLRDGMIRKLIEMREGFGLVQDEDKMNRQIGGLFASTFDMNKNKNQGDDGYKEDGNSLLAFVGIASDDEKKKRGSSVHSKTVSGKKHERVVAGRKNKDEEVYNPDLVKIEEDEESDMRDLFKKLGKNTVKDKFKKEKEELNRKIKIFTERMRQANDVLREMEEDKRARRGPKQPEHLEGRQDSSLSKRERAEKNFHMMIDDSDSDEDEDEEEEIRKDIVRYEEQIDRLFKKLRVITSKEERIKKNAMNPLNRTREKYRNIENKGVNLLLQTYVYHLLSITVQFMQAKKYSSSSEQKSPGIPIPRIMSFLMREFQGKHFVQIKDLVQKYLMLYEFENLCIREASQLLALDRYKQMRTHVIEMKKGNRTEKGPFKCDVDDEGKDCLYESNTLEPKPTVFVVLFPKCGHTYHRKCLLDSIGRGKVYCKKCKEKEDDD